MPIEILQLQYIDKVIDVFFCAGPAGSCAVVGDSRDPTLAARLILDSCCMSVDFAQFIDGCERPCDHAATVVQWQCLRFCSSPRVVDIQLCNREWYSTIGGYGGDDVMAVWIGVEGFFGGIDAIFRAPPVVPELSASFRALEHSHL